MKYKKSLIVLLSLLSANSIAKPVQLTDEASINDVIAAMTLEEKASFVVVQDLIM